MKVQRNRDRAAMRTFVILLPIIFLIASVGGIFLGKHLGIF